jgi:peptide/nickel transport system substrate-binding protein
MRKARMITLAAAAVLMTAPAFAQKSADTLRIAVEDPFSVLDPFYAPHAEGGTFTRELYSHLIKFDEHAGKFVPELAKSWARVAPTVFEFELRDDVVFHSGNKFSAADVKYMLDYLRDPKTNIRFKNRYDWVQSVEALGPTKVRITSHQAAATDMSALAYHIAIFDSAVHAKLDDPADYGRVSASGTGPYRLESMDRTKGVVMHRFDRFFGSPHRRAPIKRIHGLWIADRQTQIAQLLTGGVDVLRDVSVDNARNIKDHPGLEVTPTNSQQLMYLTLDAAGRSDNKVMTDVRVRRAFIKAINRDAIIDTVVAGGKIAERPLSICFKTTTACKPTRGPEAYDPAGAKKLLAEAGYPNGLDLRVYALGPVKEIAEAIGGDLRKAGIRATIEPLVRTVHVKKRGAGEYTAFFGAYPTAAEPDVDNLLDVFFGDNRDYAHDPLIQAAMKQGAGEIDLDKRTALYTPALDRINEQAYAMGFSELPLLFAHTKDVRVEKNLLSAGEIRIGDYFWK